MNLLIENDKFYVIIETISIVKFLLPRTREVIGRGGFYYESHNIDSFIECLESNTDGSLQLVEPNDMKIFTDVLNVHFVSDEVEITLINTEHCREQLIFL